MATNNESTKITNQIDISGTTVFTSDAPIEQNSISQDNQPDGMLPIRDQGISDFLAKPFLVGVFAWNSSLIANSTVGSITPEYVLTEPIFSEKITGFKYIRATAVIRLVLNAEPFHAGKLIMSFIPCYHSLSGNEFRESCLNQATQQPNVEIDCRDSMCILRVPYIAPTDYYEISGPNPRIGWGKLDIHVLAPLKTGSGGSNDLDVTCFIHFEDVELAAPTLPQSSVRIEKRSARPTRAKAIPVTDLESRKFTGNTLSSALMVGSNVMTSLSSIPTLAPISAPAAWVTRGLAGLASWLGWSKPLVDSPPNIVARRILPNMANATGSNLAPSLGLYHDTSLTVLDNLGGVEEDEMSFAHLKRIKAYSSTFSMSTTDIKDTLLYLKFVCPKFLGQNITRVGTTHSWNANSFPPGFYIANYFKYWRGGVKMHIKIAKTDYHSGRIMIVYTPGDQPTYPVTTSSSTYSLREVVDIRDSNEIVLDLPYLLNTPYQIVEKSMGTLNIMVVNELKAPSTVADSIDFIVYFSCCDDFEVAVPDGRFSNTNNAPQSVLPFFPQIGMEPSVDGVIGGYTCGEASTKEAESCVGECFTSIKQLLNRYTKVTFKVPATTYYGYMAFPPYALGGVFTYTTTQTTDQSPQCGDAISAFACGYAFMRGSVKLMSSVKQPAGASAVGYSFKWEQYPAGGVTSYAGVLDQAELSSGNVFTTPASTLNPVQYYDPVGIVEVSVPYYNKLKCTLVDVCNGLVNSSYLYPEADAYTLPRTVAAMGYTTSSDVEVLLRRAGGEDFQLGYFLGFPPICIGTTAL